MSLLNNTTQRPWTLEVGAHSLVPTGKNKLKTSESFRLQRLVLKNLESFFHLILPIPSSLRDDGF